MLQHVWERASQARYLTSVTIATDDERIRTEAEKFHARVAMTREDHPSGTDRVAEVASASTSQVIVNIQGDEPMLEPAFLSRHTDVRSIKPTGIRQVLPRRMKAGV